MTDVSFLGSRTWSGSASGSGSGCGRSGSGCDSWSGSGSRSGSRSAIWTWSTSRRTWTTSSWSGKKSALGFWICSETGRGHCCAFPGPSAAVPASSLGRTRRGRSAPSLHCFWACHGKGDYKRPPRLPRASRWAAWGVGGGCLLGPKACTHGLPASRGGPSALQADRSRARWGPG